MTQFISLFLVAALLPFAAIAQDKCRDQGEAEQNRIVQLRKSKLERAVQERLQRLSTQQLRELTVKREIYDALDTTEQNWQRILAVRQNVILAGLNYDAELKQFREGLRTMTEVLETLSRLGDAQLREVRAVTDYQISLIDLAFATGTLLGHSHVS